MTKIKEIKKRKLTINIDSTYKYLQLWNGIFHLTDKEMQILASFIDVQELKGGENLCSIENKKDVSYMVGIKDYNTLNNYIKRFKDKKVIKKEGPIYKLNSFLDPNTSMVEVVIKRI